MSDQRWPNAILEENSWHCVDICRACWAKEAIMSARWAKWRFAQTSFVNVGPTILQQNANVGITNDCYLGWMEILTSESIMIDFSIRKALFWIYGSNRFSIILKCFSYIDSFYVQGDVKKKIKDWYDKYNTF